MTRGGAARKLAPAALMLLLAVLLLAPATLGGKVISAGDMALFQAPFPPPPVGSAPDSPLQFDSAFVFEPDGLLVRDALRSGALPVWTDALSAGRPLLAAQQSAPMFPLTWLGVVFPFWEAQAWILVLKLVLAALGVILLARALGLGLPAALVAGIAFGFGTYLVDWLMHPHSNAYLTLPWLFLFSHRLCRSGAVRDACLLGAVFGLAFAGGHPQSALLASLATAAWFVYGLVAAHRSGRSAWRRFGLGTVAAALGLGLAAIMLVPFLEALSQAYQTSRGVDPLEARAGLSIFFPEYWGRPDRANTALGPQNFSERTIYVGVLPTLLAIAGLVARRPAGQQLFFAGLTLVSLVIVLDSGPVTALVSDLPGLSSVNLNRFLIVTSFGLAMLAGFGVDRFVRGDPAERRRLLIAAGIMALLPVCVVLVAHPSWLGEFREATRRMLGLGSLETGEVIALASVLRWTVLAAATIALLAALTFWRRRSPVLLGAAVAVVAADLLAMGFGFNPAIPKAEAEPDRPRPVEVMDGLTVRGGRVVGIGGLEPNTASRWGLDDARGHEQPLVERTSRLWYGLGGTADAATLTVAPQDQRTPALLDVFGVRAVLLAPAFKVGSEVILEPLRRDPVAYAGDDGVVLARGSALPPAFVAHRWRRSSGLDESLGQMALGSSRSARDEPVIESAERPAADAPARPSPAQVISRTETEVTVEVDAEAAGQLILNDTYYPGWIAEVDGESAEIRPANAAFRAVEVPAGRHEVRFSYRPASVLAGALMSLVALLLLMGGLLLFRRRPDATASREDGDSGARRNGPRPETADTPLRAG